jgi:hypothetical protein
VLGVVGVADAERDVVTTVAPRRAQRAADVARADDGDLDGLLLYTVLRLARYLRLSRAYPMI